MRWLFAAFVLLYTLTISAVILNAQPDQVSVYEAAEPNITKLIDLVHHEEYDQALRVAESLAQRYPGHPIGYFYQAAIYDTILRDYRDERYLSLFEQSLDTAIETGLKLLDTIERRGDTPDAWLHFYLGGALGYRGLHKFFKNDFFGAFYDGLSGVNHLKVCHELNPQLYDINYGLGCFYYWTSAKSRLLWFLPFINDRREFGIESVKLAIEKGKYVTVEAQYALMRIYNNERLFDKTLELGQTLHNQFPADPFCFIEMGYAYRQMEDWRMIKETYQKIIDRCMTSELHCFERIAESSLYRVEAMVQLRDPDSITEELRFVEMELKRRKTNGQLITSQAEKYVKQIQRLAKKHGTSR